MVRARTTLVWIVLLSLMTFVTLTTSGTTAQKPWWDNRPTEQRLWSYSTMTDDRIVLRYPDIMPEETARALLENRRAALEFVEDFLRVELGKPVTIQIYVSLIAYTGEVIASLQPEILFHIPFHRLQNMPPLSAGNAHEEVHVVAYHAWSPPLSRFLGEGMAVAIDFRSRPRTTYDPHLFSKGLTLKDELMPIESLFLQQFAPSLPASRVSLYIYVESASFVLFLIDHYGLEKLKQLNEASGLPFSMFEEKVCKIYGQGLASLEQDWHRFLESYGVGQEARAKYVVLAMFDFSDRITDSLSELEKYWNRSPFQLVSPSEKVSDEYGTLMRLLVALGCSSDQEMTRNEADNAYDAFERTLTAIESLSTTWLKAIRTFEETLSSMSTADVDNYGSLIARLEEAWERYQHVGDDGTAERVGKFIAALQCVVKGRDAFASGAPQAAEELLLKASSLFAKLGRQEMVNKVDHLLEVYRCVTP